MDTIAAHVRVHLRSMKRRDLPEVLAIEADSFEFPWLKEDFLDYLKQRNYIGMVAEHKDLVVGFMIYEYNKTRFQVLKVATAPDFLRRGVGTQMVSRLLGKLSSAQRHSWVFLDVRETNLAAQLFFRSVGFRAVFISREYYEDTSEDGYLMEYQLHVAKDEVDRREN